MPDVDAVLARTARRFYDDEATDNERAAIDEALIDLCDDPAVDEVTKFPFRWRTSGLAIYTSPTAWMIYRSLNA